MPKRKYQEPVEEALTWLLAGFLNWLIRITLVLAESVLVRR